MRRFALAVLFAAISCTPAPPAPRTPVAEHDRFLVDGDLVWDRKHHLMWERDARAPASTYAEAEARCQTLRLGTHGGFRLPERDELRGLVDDRGEAPVIDGAAFPGAPAEWFWSRTRFEGTRRFVWGVSFEYGGLHYLYESNRYRSRCVQHGGDPVGVVREPPPSKPAPTPNATVESAEKRADYIVLRVRAPQLPAYQPGQTVLLGLPAAVQRTSPQAEAWGADASALLRRRYTITSVPNANALEVGVRLRADGELSPRLFSLQPGSPVYLSQDVRGPKLPERVNGRATILVATGIGVAHYVAYARAEGCKGPKVVLVHGGRTAKELFFVTELEEVAKKCPSFVYLPTLLEPEPGWTGLRGSVEDALQKGPVADRLGGPPSPKSAYVSMCATLSVVDSLIDWFAQGGFTPEARALDWCEAD
jgi:NAD(P)H-flavin reductase